MNFSRLHLCSVGMKSAEEGGKRVRSEDSGSSSSPIDDPETLLRLKKELHATHLKIFDTSNETALALMGIDTSSQRSAQLRQLKIEMDRVDNLIDENPKAKKLLEESQKMVRRIMSAEITEDDRLGSAEGNGLWPEPPKDMLSGAPVYRGM